MEDIGKEVAGILSQLGKTMSMSNYSPTAAAIKAGVVVRVITRVRYSRHDWRYLDHWVVRDYTRIANRSLRLL